MAGRLRLGDEPSARTLFVPFGHGLSHVGETLRGAAVDGIRRILAVQSVLAGGNSGEELKGFLDGVGGVHDESAGFDCVHHIAAQGEMLRVLGGNLACR